MKFLLSIAVAAFAALAIQSMPDIARYLKLREM
ncbi:MAG: DUF6893 family small protein [Acidimicrobiales bacterium]